MLGITKSKKQEASCLVFQGELGHLDPKQPPTKRKPYSSILNHSFVHRTELIIPEELLEIISKDVLEKHTPPEYCEVILPLNALLEGKFFNDYIKKGDILMLSEGKIGRDNVYSLKDGVLTLHLDRESYERAGLVGKPDGVKGKRGTKPWWVVEINLRQPSMLHGKKGFDRILYGFRNALPTPVTWLFCDLSTTTLVPSPINMHFPIKKKVSVQISQNITVKMPSLYPPADTNPDYGADFDDYALEAREWLSTVGHNSDPFPSDHGPSGDFNEQKVVKISWQGFSSPSWCHQTFVKLLMALPKDAWFSYSVDGFPETWQDSGKNSMILKLPDASTKCVLWETA